MTTIEALEAAIGMLEAIAGGKVLSRADCSKDLDLLKRARDEYHQGRGHDAQRRAQIRALSGLLRGKTRY